MGSSATAPGCLRRAGTLCCLFALCGAASAELREAAQGAFVIQHSLRLPGEPGEIYAALTGDISGWWDHTFSAEPARFFVDARPGGGFYEYFDPAGDNGVQHATVIYAQSGRRLVMRGPLGLSGHAIDLVISYDLEPVPPEESQSPQTLLQLTVSAAGRVEPGWAESIDKVWRHFLLERFQPYVEAGCHRRADCEPKWGDAAASE